MTTKAVARLLAIAGSQHGVLTAQQAQRADVSADRIKRLVRVGVLDRPDVGVLRVVGTRQTWEQDLMVASLRSGPTAAVSHRAAARLWGLEGFDQAPVEISIPKGHRRFPHRGIVRQSRDLDRSQLTRRNGIQVTNPARTLVDLAALVAPTRFEVAFDDALRQGLTTQDRVWAAADRLARQGRSGPAVVKELIASRDRPNQLTDSGFETQLLGILRQAGLPTPATQHEIFDGDGVFVMRLDAAYVADQIGIEADSERWHMSRQRFVNDRTKRSTAESLGWRVLAFTFHHVTQEPDFVAATVERTLATSCSITGRGLVR